MKKGGFSWKRLTGITKTKQKVSRKTGIPLTKSGRQRKIGKIVTGGKRCLITLSIPIVLIVLTTFTFAKGNKFPFKLQDLVNKSPSAIEKVLGKPGKLIDDTYENGTKTFKIKRGSYMNNAVEISFVDGGARWITIQLEECTNYEQLSKTMKRCLETKSNFDTYYYPQDSSNLLKDLGLNSSLSPDFSNDYAIRYHNIGDIYEVSLFPIQDKINYALVLTNKKYE